MNAHSAHSAFFETMFNALNVGVLLIDAQENIVFMNEWMKLHLGERQLSYQNVPFLSLFPMLSDSRLHHAIQAALKKGFSAVLSQSLNRAPFPLMTKSAERTSRPHRMQQAIRVIPMRLSDAETYSVMIEVMDVTATVHRERLLRDHAEELARFSYEDSLTGLANRRRLDDFLREAKEGACHYEQPLAIIMVDVDYFKAYNDYKGHQAGDKALIAVSRLMENALGSINHRFLLARYGGEEFCVVLPNMELKAAQCVAELLRHSVEEARIPHGKTPNGSKYLTLSLGVAICDCGGCGEVIARADAALYEAKQTGRNRICVAPDEATLS